MSQKKPKLETLKKLEEINDRINKLYDIKRTTILKMMKAYGPNEFVFQLPEIDAEGHKFVRYKLIDNLEAFGSGEPMYKSTAFERYGFESRYLKREPKND